MATVFSIFFILVVAFAQLSRVIPAWAREAQTPTRNCVMKQYPFVKSLPKGQGYSAPQTSENGNLVLFFKQDSGTAVLADSRSGEWDESFASGGPIKKSQFSRDGKKLAWSSLLTKSSRILSTLYVRDIEQKSTIEIPYENGCGFSFSRSSSDELSVVQCDGRFVKYDLKAESGGAGDRAVPKILFSKQLPNRMRQEDGMRFDSNGPGMPGYFPAGLGEEGNSDEQLYFLVDYDQGKAYPVQRFFGSSENGRVVVIRNSKADLSGSILNLDSGQLTPISRIRPIKPGQFVSSGLSPDGRYVVMIDRSSGSTGTQDPLKIYDQNTKSLLNLPINSANVGGVVFHGDPTQVGIIERSGRTSTLRTFDGSTGKEGSSLTLGEVRIQVVRKQGDWLIMEKERGPEPSTLLLNLRTQTRRELSGVLVHAIKGDGEVLGSTTRGALVIYKPICGMEFDREKNEDSSQGCKPEKSGLGLQALTKVWNDFRAPPSFAGACEQSKADQPHSASELAAFQNWFDTHSHAASLPLEEVKTGLRAFQLRDLQYQSEQMLPYLITAIQSDIRHSHPELIRAALLRVFYEDYATYRNILEQFPDLEQLPRGSFGDSCFSSSFLQSVRSKLVSLLVGGDSQTAPKTLDQIAPLAGILEGLNPKEREDLAESVGLPIAENLVALKPQLQSLPVAEIYYFLKPKLLDALGFPVEKQELIDVSISADQGQKHPVILSTSKIDQDETTVMPMGFYAKRLNALPVPNETDPQPERMLQWTSGGKPYQAKLHITPVPLEQIAPRRPSPDYGALWKDGKLTGMVITDTNLGNDQEFLMKRYRDYYSERGFSFGSTLRKVENFQEFLAEKVKSGELDYLMKEGHSGGDQRNLATLPSAVEIAEGVRKTRDGKIEKVYLPFPSPSAKSRAVSTQDFGAWLKPREKTDQGELVYFNTSCYSVVQARHEITGAKTRKLVVIPSESKSTNWYFRNAPDSAQYQLLESLRAGKNFEGFRQALQSDPLYAKRTNNVFIFPDEPAYEQQLISSLGAAPTDVEVNITGPDGQKVEFNPLLIHNKGGR